MIRNCRMAVILHDFMVLKWCGLLAQESSYTRDTADS